VQSLLHWFLIMATLAIFTVSVPAMPRAEVYAEIGVYYSETSATRIEL
jgi:hypothetical protein